VLVLTCRTDESLVIGDGVIVTVVSVGRGSVRLGVSAPREVQVYRETTLNPRSKPRPPA